MKRSDYTAGRAWLPTLCINHFGWKVQRGVINPKAVGGWHSRKGTEVPGPEVPGIQ